MPRPKARPAVRSRGTAHSYLELLQALRPIACEEPHPGRLLARTARLLATTFSAYCVVDAIELEPRRVEIVHADLSRMEQLRHAARATSPLAVQQILDLARPGEAKLVTSKRALASLDFGFMNSANACVVLPVLVDGELQAVLTVVTARRSFTALELSLLADVPAWAGLGLARLASQAKTVGSVFPASTRMRSA